jgi:hypothetical protein
LLTPYRHVQVRLSADALAIPMNPGGPDLRRVASPAATAASTFCSHCDRDIAKSRTASAFETSSVSARWANRGLANVISANIANIVAIRGAHPPASTNGEIGTILSLSVRAVAEHLERMYPRLGVENRTAAAARALEVLRSHTD